MNENVESQSQSQAGARPLLRRHDGRVLGGVAGGLADYTGVDPVVVRISFVALALLGGIGLPLYLVLWALVPDRAGDEPIGETLLRRLAAAPGWLRVILLVVAVWAALGALGPVSAAAVLLLAVVGVAALAHDRRTSGRA